MELFGCVLRIGRLWYLKSPLDEFEHILLLAFCIDMPRLFAAMLQLFINKSKQECETFLDFHVHTLCFALSLDMLHSMPCMWICQDPITAVKSQYNLHCEFLVALLPFNALHGQHSSYLFPLLHLFQTWTNDIEGCFQEYFIQSSADSQYYTKTFKQCMIADLS